MPFLVKKNQIVSYFFIKIYHPKQRKKPILQYSIGYMHPILHHQIIRIHHQTLEIFSAKMAAILNFES